jgi:hypothetical protein
MAVKRGAGGNLRCFIRSPLVVDEAEIAFTPLDSDVNVGAAQENGIMTWTDYVD